MTNRHWYDDSNGERRGGMQGNQASLPVMIFFLQYDQLSFLGCFLFFITVTFHLFFF